MDGPAVASARAEEQREREQAHPEDDQSQVDQLDDSHTASGPGQRRGRDGIGQIRFRTVLVVVPAVVQSHPASVAQVPKLSIASLCVPRAAATEFYGWAWHAARPLAR